MSLGGVTGTTYPWRGSWYTGQASSGSLQNSSMVMRLVVAAIRSILDESEGSVEPSIFRTEKPLASEARGGPRPRPVPRRFGRAPMRTGTTEKRRWGGGLHQHEVRVDYREGEQGAVHAIQEAAVAGEDSAAVFDVRTALH